MPRTLPISEVKARLPELVKDVQEREEEVVVTRNGRPAAVLLNVDEYERLKATIDVLSDPELMRPTARPCRSIMSSRRACRLWLSASAPARADLKRSANSSKRCRQIQVWRSFSSSTSRPI